MLDPYETLKADPEDAAKYYYKHGKPEQLQEFIQEYEESIIDNSLESYYYARDILNGRWPRGEKAIRTSPMCAYRYAKYIIQDRWPEAESIMATLPISSYYYSLSIIKGRWPEGEGAIATSEEYSCLYAIYVLRGRFELGEKIIHSGGYSQIYQDSLDELHRSNST